MSSGKTLTLKISCNEININTLRNAIITNMIHPLLKRFLVLAKPKENTLTSPAMTTFLYNILAVRARDISHIANHCMKIKRFSKCTRVLTVFCKTKRLVITVIHFWKVYFTESAHDVGYTKSRTTLQFIFNPINGETGWGVMIIIKNK